MANIRRPFDWISRVFDARSVRVSPQDLLPVFSPTFDGFGTESVGQMQRSIVLGALGGIEVTDTPVPEGRWRHYFSMQLFHDDVVTAQNCALMRVPNEAGLFPQLILQNDITLLAFFSTTARNVAVGPRVRAGGRSFAMGAAARLTFQGYFIEYDVGEYPKIEGQG